MLAKQVMVVESKLSPDGIRNLEASGSPGRCKSRLEAVEPWTVKLSPQLIEIWKFVEERAVDRSRKNPILHPVANGDGPIAPPLYEAGRRQAILDIVVAEESRGG